MQKAQRHDDRLRKRSPRPHPYLRLGTARYVLAGLGNVMTCDTTVYGASRGAATFCVVARESRPTH